MRGGLEPVYHAGERYVQQRAGQSAAAASLGDMIGREIPPAAAEFLAEREMLVLAAADGDGRIWTTQLSGAPGFMRASDDRTVRVAARAHPGDPLARALAATVAVGTIAIDFATRRRMRLNGTSTGDAHGITIATDQVYANCPKFISARSVEASGDPASPEMRSSDRLDDAARRLVETAETFFIGTAYGAGADASHRGGDAGFVSVEDDRTLRWPDYRGSGMFMTLGNVVVSPRAGLLFMDWEHGHALQLAGTATIDWNPAAAARFPGAQRTVTYRVERVAATANASPLRWSKAVPSRVNPRSTASGAAR